MLILARFMESIRWVDKTNTDKHKNDVKAQVASWYPPLRQLTNARLDASSPESTKHPNAVISRLHTFFRRMAKRTGFSVAFYVASQLPYIGPFVYPVASFATFNKAVGPAPAAGIFLLGLVLPKRILIVFFQSFFSSRSLMRVLVSLSQPVLHCNFLGTLTEVNTRSSLFLSRSAITAPAIFRSDSIHTKPKIPMVL